MEDLMSIIVIISFIIAVLGSPFIISKYRNYLGRKLSKYNHKEKTILATSIPLIGLAIALGILAVAQFENSIPTLLDLQTQPANLTNYAFQDLMLFGVFSGIICSFLCYNLLRVNLKELRIVLSPKK